MGSLFLTKFYINCINLCIPLGNTFLKPGNLFTLIFAFHSICRSIFLACVCLPVYVEIYDPFYRFQATECTYYR